jgi:Protein of unknown function (DUF742)
VTAGDEPSEGHWVDDYAGPVVRPYAMTRGRTQPSAGKFDLISLVIAARAPSSLDIELGPEHLAILACCQRVLSVAEVAAHLDLPLGTVRVLLGDLLERKLVEVREPPPVASFPDTRVFEAVINGLRRL